MDNYNCVIKVKADASLHQALLAEIAEHTWERSAFTLKKEKQLVIIEITAADATALRATFNSITKLLAVHEKIQKVE